MYPSLSPSAHLIAGQSCVPANPPLQKLGGVRYFMVTTNERLARLFLGEVVDVSAKTSVPTKPDSLDGRYFQLNEPLE